MFFAKLLALFRRTSTQFLLLMSTLLLKVNGHTLVLLKPSRLSLLTVLCFLLESTFSLTIIPSLHPSHSSNLHPNLLLSIQLLFRVPSMLMIAQMMETAAVMINHKGIKAWMMLVGNELKEEYHLMIQATNHLEISPFNVKKRVKREMRGERRKRPESRSQLEPSQPTLKWPN